MAKPGVYKSEVKKARDSLVAQGKHPSVDAVRIALGNTGSKTTIHKYLKELEVEKGGADARQVSISEALQDLVERLATQLQEEANGQIDAARAQQAEQGKRHAAALTAAQQEAAQWRDQAQQFDTALQNERAAHAQTREALQQETITRHTAEQHARDLKDRLAENEAHRQSLEEKHQHARGALEHYRQSVKEQRDQDARRHEQQIQQLQAELRMVQQTVSVKQEDVTRLNQEGARLVAELSHAQQALREEQERGRRLAARIDVLQVIEQRCGILEAQGAEREVMIEDLRRQHAAASSSAQSLRDQMQTTQLELASAKAALAAQQDIAAELRTFLDTRAKS
ncbi:MAG TPA: DNA-binding protein [Noviherbaspirillum sp.]